MDTYEVSGRRHRDLAWSLECDDILTFDIEVSSGFMREDGTIINYHPGETETYWNKLTALSLCYIWQFSYNDNVYYGRNLKEFREVLDMLPRDIHFIIFIHNLSYEFSFLANILAELSGFAREAHKVMYAVSAEYPNVEFRCSYMLTRLSLADWSKKLPVKKLKTLDYDEKIRTPRTKLTDLEMDYCEHDCLVVYEGIKTYLERYGHIVKIPLTQTGEVRRELKQKIVKNRALQRQMVSLLPDARMYRILKKCFCGGYTHANFTLADRVIDKDDFIGCETGKHYDFTSSYPYVMLSEKFCMTQFRECETFDRDWDEFGYLVRIRFYRVEAKTYNHYISASKCFKPESDFFGDSKIEEATELELDNGRVITNWSDDEEDFVAFDMWLTEQDFDIIEKTYKINYEVIECYKSRKQYLPREICEFILKLYKDKTELKDVAGQEAFYVIAKQFINSIFGMSVTDLVQDEYKFDGINWDKTIKTFFDVETELYDLKCDNKNKTFMAYQWGVWITAFARHNLWECVLRGDNGKDKNSVIYCDTDSIFCREDIDFSDYNANCRVKLQAMCDFHGLNIADTEPYDKKGIQHPLGEFSAETDWTEFVTLGAKRYCVRESDGKLHLTVSGINKDAVECLHDDIRNFNKDCVFDKDEASVAKKMIKHLNNQPCATWNRGEYDEFESDYDFGINMRPTGYSMSMTDEYLMLCNAAVVVSHLECLE